MTSVSAFVPFAFSAGIATFFAPCAFPLLPGYVSYYVGRDDSTPDSTLSTVTRAALIGIVVSAGFFLVYGLLTGVVVVFGSALLSNVSLLELIVGTVMIGLGGVMLSGRQLSLTHVRLPERRRTLPGFFAFGVLYAAAAAGCTAPVFAAVAVNALSLGPVSGVLTLVAYALGMSVLMVGVTVAASLGRDVLVRRMAARAGLIQRLAGGLLIVAGVYQLYLFLFEFGGRELLGLA